MLTDIFAYRYLEQPIWSAYTEIEQRLLNQAFGIVKDALPYWSDSKEDEKQKAKWKQLHDQLARELGVEELSQRYYSYTQKNALGHEFPMSGWFSWDHVCGQFVNAKYAAHIEADRFIKERISFIELALRLRGEEIATVNANLRAAIQQAAFRDATTRSSSRVPGSAVDGVKAWNATLNSVFHNQVSELNERFRRARAPLTYHNGFIQLHHRCANKSLCHARQTGQQFVGLRA
jgi:AbiJ-like protein